MTFYLKTFYFKVINLLRYILVLKNSKTCAPTGKRPALKKAHNLQTNNMTEKGTPPIYAVSNVV